MPNIRVLKNALFSHQSILTIANLHASLTNIGIFTKSEPGLFLHGSDPTQFQASYLVSPYPPMCLGTFHTDPYFGSLFQS